VTCPVQLSKINRFPFRFTLPPNHNQIVNCSFFKSYAYPLFLSNTISGVYETSTGHETAFPYMLIKNRNLTAETPRTRRSDSFVWR
jgi:hypothetical protein